MRLEVENVQGRVPIALVSLHGSLDASNYEEVIAKAKELHAQGVQYMLLDMSDMPFMSSSGLVALHTIALLLQGGPLPDEELGWQAFHSLSHDRDSGVQPHVKLLNPQPKIVQTLQITSMTNFFEIYDDRRAAIDSF